MATQQDFRVKNGLVVATTATISGTQQSTSISTGALIVDGGSGIAKNLYVGGTIFGTVTTATTATNILGGAQGSIPIQSAPGITAFIPIGTNGFVLTSAAGNTATWQSLSGLSAGEATTATNIKFGTAGQVPYQTAPGVTSFYGPGTAGQLLVSGGTGTPVYTNTGSIYVGRAILADSATQISTTAQTANASYYPTFVDSNNATAAAESVYTTSSFTINAQTGNVTLAGDLAVNGGDITTAVTTFNLINATATTLNIGSAASTARLGATSGTLTLGNPTVVGTSASQTLYDTVATTINFAGAATTGNFGYDGTAASTTNLSIGATANATTKTINLGTGGVSGSTTNLTVGSSTAGANTNVTFNQSAASLFKVQAVQAPTTDMFQITNTGFANTTAGVNAFNVQYIGGAAAVEASAARIDITPGATTGGTWSALRVIPTAGAATGVTQNGVKFDNITAGAGTDNALYVGTGWDNILSYNGASVINGTGVVQVAFGGTNITSYAVGDILYASAATTLSKLAASTAGYVLQTNGAGTAPSWVSTATLGGGGGGAFTVVSTGTDATFYPTFVDSNNVTPTNEVAYTTSSFVLNAQTGNIGIGAAPSTFKLEVNGSFAATTKSFLIPHPTKPGMKLRYGSLEGPENGVYVRGKLTNNNIIELPDYWTALVDPDSITVQLTPIGSHQKLYVESISDNKIYISVDGWFTKDINCFFIVHAERCDVGKLDAEIY